jgi:UDP-3-O-acyl N-acetylglucosamine deacetylase
LKLKQRTIINEFAIDGIGLHTGKISKVIFKPAPRAGYGIRFIRTDINNYPEIKAILDNVSTDCMTRRTVIKQHDIEIYTIEHIMSACFALGLDNLMIEINTNEPPILDGSAKIFTEHLLKAGVKSFNHYKEYYFIEKPVYFITSNSQIYAYPSDNLEIKCTIQFQHPFLKYQTISLTNINKQFYITNIAPAKTFCFDYEVNMLRQNHLALGGSLKNAIVISMDGIHNKKCLSYNDEFVRHKVLDLMGDMHLLGKEIKAKIVAEKPGHKSNVNFLRKFVKNALIGTKSPIVESINNES